MSRVIYDVNPKPRLKSARTRGDEDVSVVHDWQSLWQEFLRLPVQSKIYVGIGAWLALSVLSFTFFGFIVAAMGVTLIVYNWPNLVTHLKDIEKSRGLFKESGQPREEDLPAGQVWHSQHASDEDLVASQEGPLEESKQVSGEDLKDVGRPYRDAPRHNRQPNDLLREAKQTLKKKSHGSSYEKSKNTAHAMALLQQIVGNYPNSKEADKARALVDKLRGY